MEAKIGVFPMQLFPNIAQGVLRRCADQFDASGLAFREPEPLT